jgi:hypothetical protein
LITCRILLDKQEAWPDCLAKKLLYKQTETCACKIRVLPTLWLFTITSKLKLDEVLDPVLKLHMLGPATHPQTPRFITKLRTCCGKRQSKHSAYLSHLWGTDMSYGFK